MNPRITVVIASACTGERSGLLERACNSVLADGSGLGQILVVANGPNCDASILAWLAGQSGIQIIRLVSGDHALARRVGAELCATEFIAFLDDDDEFLPDSLRVRIASLEAAKGASALVSNGLICDGSHASSVFPPLDTLSSDPVIRAMQHGWQSAMVTLRARDVPLSVLSPELKHNEWTYTALCLAFNHTIAITDALTFSYHRTPGSLSQTRQHILAEPEVWWRVIRLLQGTKYERLARVRLGCALHDVATVQYQDGNLREALRAHLAGLRCPSGLRRYGLTARLALELLRAASTRAW